MFHQRLDRVLPFALVLLLAACRATSFSGTGPANQGSASEEVMATSTAPTQSYPELGPADVERLGMELAPADPEGVIPMDTALSVAETLNDFSAGRVTPEAFLATVVDARSSGQGDVLAARRVWVVRYAGLGLVVPGPSVLAPATPRDHVADYAYILLDASTGDFLVSVLSE